MSERLFQGQLFDHEPLDVTPKGFSHLPQILRRPASADLNEVADLGRFIREASQPVQVISPQLAADYLQQHIFAPFSDFDQEELWVLLLNTKNWITHDALIYRGTVNTATIRIAEIFKPAVKINAPALILSHCHPSGDPEPSPEDLHVSHSIIEAGKLMGIEIMDHIIIGDNRWVSLKEKGVDFGT